MQWFSISVSEQYGELFAEDAVQGVVAQDEK
jgi:hypothetical protein